MNKVYKAHKVLPHREIIIQGEFEDLPIDGVVTVEYNNGNQVKCRVVTRGTGGVTLVRFLDGE
jgi:hypothetical protein